VSPALRFRGCTFRYAGEDAPAIAGLDLEIGPGEVVALAGPAGAGSSTLLMLAGGFAPRLTGGVLDGVIERHVRRSAIVFATPWTQLTGLAQTVRAEVAFGPASYGWPRDRVLGLADDAMRRLGVAPLADRDPVTLSGGELQRVVVASALAMEPDLLLLDDPAAELDPDGADALYDLLGVLGRGGTTVLVATPDTARAARAATRALRLEAGCVTADGPAAEVLR
jgi:energy-coupling factor transporter ATP-binding protein EcfA2